ncbi:hypothetical protein G7Y79_00032g067360 [Physcia stellaris]|nr:hypothetical protein G7Y79_00032g067360 [Physcia stellaris]
MASCDNEEKNGPPLTKNIYIIGAQSTGKTTLVSALAIHFANTKHDSPDAFIQPFQLKEVARNVLKKHGFTAHDITSSKARALELQRLIIEAQAKAEVDLGQTWYISDRSALDAVAYARQYVGVAEADKLMHGEPWRVLEDRMRSALVVLCEPGGEWLIDDGIRLMPQDREEWFQLHTRFLELLDGLRLAYIVLPSRIAKLEDRVKLILDEWANRLRRAE